MAAGMWEKRITEVDFNPNHAKWTKTTDAVTGARTYTSNADDASAKIRLADGVQQDHNNCKIGSTITVLNGDASVTML